MEPVIDADEVIQIDSHLDGGQERSLADDVLDGLTRPFKELPPKHFYDARGAELFDQICDLPEYYPTRAERAILEKSAAGPARGPPLPARRRPRARRARVRRGAHTRVPGLARAWRDR